MSVDFLKHPFLTEPPEILVIAKSNLFLLCVSSCTEFAASLSIDRSSCEGSRDRTCVAVLNSIWKIKFFFDEKPLVHYTLQFPLDCITGVSEGERKKNEGGVIECPSATSTNRRKLKNSITC